MFYFLDSIGTMIAHVKHVHWVLNKYKARAEARDRCTAATHWENCWALRAGRGRGRREKNQLYGWKKVWFGQQMICDYDVDKNDPFFWRRLLTWVSEMSWSGHCVFPEAAGVWSELHQTGSWQLNLEESVIAGGGWRAGKGIHYSFDSCLLRSYDICCPVYDQGGDIYKECCK